MHFVHEKWVFPFPPIGDREFIKKRLNNKTNTIVIVICDDNTIKPTILIIGQLPKLKQVGRSNNPFL
jgi:hypothetical protein